MQLNLVATITVGVTAFHIYYQNQYLAKQI